MICTDFQKMFSKLPPIDFHKKMNTLYTHTQPSYGSKLQIVEPVYTSLFFSPLMGKKREVKVEKFKKGDVFALQGVECDDFSMPIKEYEVIKKVDEIFGIQLDGLVVKQISGDTSTIFSLTKTDCQTLGIEFQPRLLFFPMNMNWKEVIVNQHEKVKEFNPRDMGTYPVFKETKLIERIVVRIDNVIQIGSEIRCGDFTISNKELMGGFMLVAKKNISVRNGVLREGQVIYGMNVTGGLFRHSGLLINDNSIYFEFCVGGIDPSIVDGIDFHDLFDVKVMGVPLIKRTPQEVDELVKEARRKVEETLQKSFEVALNNRKRNVMCDPLTGICEILNNNTYERRRKNNNYAWGQARDYWDSDEYDIYW